MTGEKPVDVIGGLLDIRQNTTGIGNDHVADRVDVADAVQPLEGKDHVGSALARNLAGHMSGIAALRHDCRSGLARKPHDQRNFLDGAGPEHERRRAVIEPAGLDQVGGRVGGCGEGIAGPDDVDEGGDEFGRWKYGGHGPASDHVVASSVPVAISPAARPRAAAGR